MQSGTVASPAHRRVRPWIPAALAWPFLVGAADEITVIVSSAPLAGPSRWITLGLVIASGFWVAERKTPRAAFVYLAASIVLLIGATWWSSVAEPIG